CDEGDARLDEAAGQEAGLAELVAAVAGAGFVGLLREVEGFAGVAEDQGVGLLLELVHAAEGVDLIGLGCEGVDGLKEGAALADALVGHAARRDETLDAEVR